MPKFVTLEEGAITLNTTRNSIMVTACDYKRKHGAYPVWYSSNGLRGGRKSYIDVEYILKIRADELRMYHESSSHLYFYMIDTLGKSESELARLLATNSPAFPSPNSWRTFMLRNLFTEPMSRFSKTVTRVQEFHRITKGVENGTIHA